MFSMTEPDVASSDATNIETRIERDGDEYVINGQNGGLLVLETLVARLQLLWEKMIQLLLDMNNSL